MYILLLKMISSQLSIHLLKCGRGERLGSFQWQTERSVPNELWQDSESTGNSKEDGIVILLSQFVVLQEDTRVGIHVGVWVLCLSVLSQHTWSDLVDGADQVEERIIRQVLESKLEK